tara:strand:+ start:648 stop:821 length:174 start_codon:yes stop_codon:yes gene_type:complete
MEDLNDIQRAVLVKTLTDLDYSTFYDLTGMGAQKYNVLMRAKNTLELQLNRFVRKEL